MSRDEQALRRMKELDRLMEEAYFLSNDDLRDRIISWSSKMVQEPGAALQEDINTTDEEIEKIMKGKGPTGC